MHITHIVPTLDQKYGGPVTSLCGFGTALQHAGAENSVFAAMRSDEQISPYVTQMADSGVQIVTVNDAAGGRRQHADLQHRIADLVRRSHVVHLHGVWESAHSVAVRACRQNKVPFVIRPCGMLSHYCLAQKRIKKWAYIQLRLKAMIRSAAAVHFTSQHEAREAPRFIRPDLHVIETLGINLDEFDSQTNAGDGMRKKFNISPDSTLLAFIGRMHPIKGLDILLEAFKNLAMTDSNIRLMICGPGEDGYDVSLKHRVRELTLENQVIFTGMMDRSEIRNALSEANIFILPSHHENFGVSALEALASGTPIVISENVGIEGFLRTSDVGIVAGTSAADFERAIRTLTDSPELLQRYAGNCRNAVREIFSWSSIAQRWINRYRNIGNSV